MTFKKNQNLLSIIKKSKLSQVIALLVFTFSLIHLNFIESEARTIFLPSQYISYSPSKSEAKIYGEQNLTVSISNFEDADDGDICKFLFAQYGRESAGVVYEKEAEYRSNSCQQTLTKEEQIYQAWTISVQILTNNGNFRNDSSYLFKAGPVGVVTLDAQ